MATHDRGISVIISKVSASESHVSVSTYICFIMSKNTDTDSMQIWTVPVFIIRFTERQKTEKQVTVGVFVFVWNTTDRSTTKPKQTCY